MGPFRVLQISIVVLMLFGSTWLVRAIGMAASPSGSSSTWLSSQDALAGVLQQGDKGDNNDGDGDNGDNNDGDGDNGDNNDGGGDNGDSNNNGNSNNNSNGNSNSNSNGNSNDN